MKINQITDLNRKARKFLLEHCVSKRSSEIILSGFTGFLNGNEVENLTIIRINGKWRTFCEHKLILSLRGTADCFLMTKNTIINNF